MTGNLKSSIQMVEVRPNGFVVVVGGRISGMAGTSPSKYASYVNYGYEINPKSSKLRRDYKFVEKACIEWGKFCLCV